MRGTQSRRFLIRAARLAGLSMMATLAACGGSPAGTAGATPPAASSGGTTVTLKEFSISGVQSSLPVGKLDVTISNAGSVDHELLVFKSDLAPSAYPVSADGNINEEGPGITKVSDGDNVSAGKSQTRTIDLSTAGTYLFVCNLAGHFKSGMYTAVTVK